MKIIKKKLYISFIIFILLKIFILLQVNNQRSAPLEIDDAYFYALNGKLFHSNIERKGDLYDSIRYYKEKIINNIQLISPQYENKIELHYDLYKFGFLERSLQPRYFIFSAIYGFFLGDEIKTIDKVWWYGNYLQSFIISLSMIMVLQFFLKKENYSLKLLCLTFLFFTFIISKHQILFTPHIIGSALLLIGFFNLLKNNKGKYLSLFLIIFSFHLHPAVIINTLALLIGTILYSYYNSNQKFYKETLLICLLIIISFLIEFVSVKIFNYHFYLNIFNSSYIEQEALNFTYFENLSRNIPVLFGDIFNIVKLFTFNSKLIGILIFILLNIYIFKKLQYLFFIIFSYYILLFVFQFKHWEHANGIFDYINFAFVILFSLAFAKFYYEIYFYVVKKLKQNVFKKTLNFLMLIIIGFFLLHKNTVSNQIFANRINDVSYEIKENNRINKLKISNSDCLVINDKNSFLYIAFSKYEGNICLTNNFGNSKIFNNDFLRSSKNKKYYFLNTSTKNEINFIDNPEFSLELNEKHDIFSYKLN